MADLAAHLKGSRAVLRDAQATYIVERSRIEELSSDIENLEKLLLKERAVLAKDGKKLEYIIFRHPTHARVIIVYLSAIFEPTLDHKQFKSILIQAYSPMGLAGRLGLQ